MKLVKIKHSKLFSGIQIQSLLPHISTSHFHFKPTDYSLINRTSFSLHNNKGFTNANCLQSKVHYAFKVMKNSLVTDSKFNDEDPGSPVSDFELLLLLNIQSSNIILSMLSKKNVIIGKLYIIICRFFPLPLFNIFLVMFGTLSSLGCVKIVVTTIESLFDPLISIFHKFENALEICFH